MKTIPIIRFLTMLFFTNALTAQIEIFPLWATSIPNAIHDSKYEEIQSFEGAVLNSVSKVTLPTLTVYRPKNPNGTSIIIFPGGGYQNLSINKEGYKVAEWLNTLGITAIVLKYRLPSDRIMKDKRVGPLQDAQEAVRFVRRHTEQWTLKKDKIGVLGFSAGGHLAATLSTQYDAPVYEASESISAKPDFSILLYPVISMKEDMTHQGSKINLLGKTPDLESIQNYSNELKVNAATPVTFLVHAVDDKAVPYQNSLDYFTALNKNNVPAELHLYQKGGHGFGLGKEDTSQYWTQPCEAWLRELSFLDQ